MFIKRYALFVSFLFFFLNATSQDISTNIHGKKMKDFMNEEKRMGGKLCLAEKDVIPPPGMAIPITYERTEKDIPNLRVTYTFSIRDSLIDYIKYEWAIKSLENNTIKQRLIVQKAMIKRYQLLASQMRQKLGEGEIRGNVSDLHKINEKGGLRCHEVWFPDDSSFVEVSAMFNNVKEEEPPIFVYPTSLIGVFVQNTAKSDYPTESDDAKNMASKTLEQFLVKLRAEDEEGAKKLISSVIRKSMTSSMLAKIKETVKPEPLVIFSDTTSLINNINFLVIDFAYMSNSEDPNELVRVTFDPDHHIIALQVRHRKE